VIEVQIILNSKNHTSVVIFGLVSLDSGTDEFRILHNEVKRTFRGSGGQFTGGWTTGLLLVENSMTYQGVTLLHTY
jgi:hypothetical protein